MEPWSSRNVVDYYLKHRNKVDDLYQSEKFFMEESLRKGKSVLDVGCAAGSFSEIVKMYNKNLEYTGVDISASMIYEAKRRFPDDSFFTCDGRTLDFPDNSFDIVLCFGVLHMTENWKKLLTEQWRVCRETLLFDVRIVEDKGICNAEESYQRLEFDGNWDGISKAPYIILSLDEILGLLTAMEPKVRTLKTYGYWHPVSKSAVSKYKTVCMSVFCLGEKGKGDLNIQSWKLPIKLPTKLEKYCDVK
jgi:SAM-dependent methyltransferase